MRFPAEWEPHELTIMGWPCRRSLWGETLDQARADYATVANAIAAFEPVRMVANPGFEAEQARQACSASVDVVELPIDDSWLRDSGPLYVWDGEHRLAIHFQFNAWGEKFLPWDHDAAIGRLVAERLGDEVREAPIVLEGGSVLSDGAGTILTTEQCLLHPSRNPDRSQAELEAVLIEQLGAARVVWLGDGLVEDRDTDGHVDLIAAFVGARRALVLAAGPENPNHERCAENLGRLAAAGIEALPVPYLPYVEVAGERVAVSYLNLYICNGAVIVPVAGADCDAAALELIAAALPGREIVTVPGAVIAFGGGGPHCITQQVPAYHGAAPHTL